MLLCYNNSQSQRGETMNNQDILLVDDVYLLMEIATTMYQDNEEYLAKKLYRLCNYTKLNKNIKYYKKLGMKELEYLQKLKTMYDNFDKKGYFPFNNNIYRCSTEEIELRLSKVNELWSVFTKTNNPYFRIKEFLQLYDNIEKFRKSYTQFVNYTFKDNLIKKAHIALTNFDKMYNTLKEYEEKGLFAEVVYLTEVEEYNKYYYTARYIIKTFLNASSKEEFLKEQKITEQELSYYAEVIDELDVELSKKYQAKSQTLLQIHNEKLIRTYNELTIGIKTGKLPDGTPFNTLEFLKRAPFINREEIALRTTGEFYSKTIQYLRKKPELDYETIIIYIRTQRLDDKSAFRPISKETIYTSKIKLQDKYLTSEDKTNIINYIELSNLPLVYKIYSIVKKMYISGEITTQDIEKLKNNNQSKRKSIKK